MSFFRPSFLEDLIKPRIAVSPRLRGLKSFEPHHIVANQDLLYAEDPQFWILFGALAGAVANLGHVGVQVPADDSLICVVDGVLIDNVAADTFSIDVTEGGAGVLSLTTDQAVTKRNRRELSKSTGVERVGLLRISDNGGVGTGTTIARVTMVAGSPSFVHDVPYRLFAGDQYFVRNGVANIAIGATMWGRLTSKGAR